MKHITRKSITPKVQLRFWSKVDRSGGHGACWPWIAKAATKERQGQHGIIGGYGLITVTCDDGRSRRIYSHRMAYFLCIGDIPEGAHVLHRCDFPRCCNPAHLFLGDAQINADDRVQKGRSTYQYRVPIDQRITIFDRFIAGESQTALAQHYGISQPAIHKIVKRFRRLYLESVFMSETSTN